MRDVLMRGLGAKNAGFPAECGLGGVVYFCWAGELKGFGCTISGCGDCIRNQGSNSHRLAPLSQTGT